MEGDRGEPAFSAARYLIEARKRSGPGLGYSERRAYATAEGYGVDWFYWRIVLASKWRTSIADVRGMALRDVIEAHAVLDLLDAVTPSPASR